MFFIEKEKEKEIIHERNELNGSIITAYTGFRDILKSKVNNILDINSKYGQDNNKMVTPKDLFNSVFTSNTSKKAKEKSKTEKFNIIRTNKSKEKISLIKKYDTEDVRNKVNFIDKYTNHIIEDDFEHPFINNDL